MRLVLLLALIFIGCERPSVDKSVDKTEDSKFVLTNSLKNVVKEFKSMSKEDQDILYKQWAGAASFVKNSKSPHSTKDFDPILTKVQADYGWNREKYPGLTNAVSDYLKEQGFEEPRELVSSSDREWFYNIFFSLSMAIKNE